MSGDGKDRQHTAHLNGSMLSVEKAEQEVGGGEREQQITQDVRLYAQETQRAQNVLDSLEALSMALAQQQVASGEYRPANLDEHDSAQTSLVDHCIECIKHSLGCHFVMLAAFHQEEKLFTPFGSAGDAPSYTQYWGGKVAIDLLLQDAAQFQRLCQGEVLVLDRPHASDNNHLMYRVIAPMLQQDSLLGILFLDYGSVPPLLLSSELALIRSLSCMLAFVIQRDRELREHERIVCSLQASNEELMYTNTMKTNFIATVNHEFRTILTGIQKCSEIIRDHELGLETLKEFAIDIHTDVRRLLRMINDMLDLERIESRQVDVCLEWVNLNMIIAGVVKRMHFIAPHHHITLNLTIAIPILLGDREKLTLVVSHLLSHVIESTPKGSIITVSSHVEENMVHVSMHNQVRGPLADSLTYLFASCTRPEHAQKSAETETGRDLSAAQHIVQMHGGQIWSENSAQHGLALHFTICFA
ncbi:sensor histidine kinase [Dictyobacter kobayashii]|uniref:histidine kinase n=1 Tax=Dictyobacter kobayashii TaxID=2014872 RepID=A0A402AFI8_9CHLR|nr:HAMP domain-containing sensor histidine kinase [Dictyobacter kobayashii]GCE17834.1 hypothetical protein KDK_16340 [Dictyobacter kobayashii]